MRIRRQLLAVSLRRSSGAYCFFRHIVRLPHTHTRTYVRHRVAPVADLSVADRGGREAPLRFRGAGRSVSVARRGPESALGRGKSPV